MDRPKRIHLQSVSEYSDRFIQNVATDSRAITYGYGDEAGAAEWLAW